MHTWAASLIWLNAVVWLIVALFYCKRVKLSQSRRTYPLECVFVAVAIVICLDRFYTAFVFSDGLGLLQSRDLYLMGNRIIREVINALLLTLGASILVFGARKIDDLDQFLSKTHLYVRYRYMIEADPRAILFFQANHNLMEINRQACEWLKGTEAELRGLAPSEVLARLSDQDPSALLERIKRKEPVEVRIGDRILSEFEWSDLIDEQSERLGSVLCFRDVTEEKKFQREIIQSEKLAVVGQLAAATAHEIRNPLTSIKGFLQLLDQRLKGSPHQGETQEYTRIMVEEIDRMEKIIRDFLLMTKPSDALRETADLNAVIERILVLVQNQATLRNIHVETTLVPLPAVQMHKEAIQQVLLNLLQNAFEAMNIGGTLTIQTEEDVNEIAVKITDTGVGMTEEQIANLGSPFYSTKTEGTGLGLTVSSKIVREHGGRLEVESQRGVGTTVVVRLPK